MNVRYLCTFLRVHPHSIFHLCFLKMLVQFYLERVRDVDCLDFPVVLAEHANRRPFLAVQPLPLHDELLQFFLGERFHGRG